MKRFTETTKWDDPWYRKLPPKLKCLWQYLCDRCDPAGVIDMDFDLASFQIGTKVSEEDMGQLGARVEKLDCGKWWIVRFVAFQYGKLSSECKAHVPVLSSLSAYSLSDRVSEGYRKGIHTLQDKDKEKDTVQDTEKDTDKRARATAERKDRGTLQELRDFCVSIGLPPSDGEATFHKWEGNGWTNGGEKIKDWRATIRNWKTRGFMPSQDSKSVPASVRAVQQGRHYPGPTHVNVVDVNELFRLEQEEEARLAAEKQRESA